MLTLTTSFDPHTHTYTFTVLMDGLITRDDKQGASQEHIEKIFVFTIMWSVGALLEWDDREKLQKFMTGQCWNGQLDTGPG